MNYLKQLMEKRNGKVTEMQGMLDKVKGEERTMSEDEFKSFNTIDKEVKDLDALIAAETRARGLEINSNFANATDTKAEERAVVEEKVFANYIRGVVSEERADINMTTGDNGAVIPSSIANKIIKKVYDITPLYQLATKYNVGGTMTIPYYDEATQQITMAYATEFVDLESKSGKFTNITLQGFLAGALAKVSKSLVNNSNFDIVSFVVNAMAESISRWVEKELLNGTSAKITGLSGATQSQIALSATAVAADELIDVQELVPDVYQADAIWIMNRATRKAIRKLKDGDGTYLLQKDFNAKWGYTLLGKDVYTSTNMPEMAIAATAIYYGDMSGLAVKLSEDISIEVLREKFATQHAIGVVGWMELDSKIENAQKIAKLQMKLT